MLTCLGAMSCVMVSTLDQQTFSSEFEFHCVPILYGRMPYLSKKPSKLLNANLLVSPEIP